mgnify:CR=1 FL=1
MANKKREEYGGSVYDQQYFTDDELRSAAEIRAAAQAGRTSWDDAHKYVEGIRNKYGYSGGANGYSYNQAQGGKNADGSYKTSYNSSASMTTKKGSAAPGSFSYEDAPQYVNKYKDQIDSLTQQILNREAFNYDAEKDPTYQQFRDTYTREGKKAMEDTLGQVSARTGGLASSYAGTVAQQSYNDYMTKLSDKIPELRQLAYSMYQDEGDRQRQNLEMLTALEQGDYAKYADLLAQYNTNRNFDYGAYRDNVSDLRYGDEMALQKAETMAAAGDFSGYKALGYTDDEIAKLKAAYQASQSLGGYSGGGYSGGSSRSSGSSPSRSTGSGDIYTKMNNAGIQSEQSARAYLLSAGYNQTDASRIAAYYATDWRKNKRSGAGDPLTSSTKTQTPAFASRSAAVNYLKSRGASDSEINGLLTEDAWKKKRSTYTLTGYGDEAVKAYSSYREYLNAFTQYAMERYGK